MRALWLANCLSSSAALPGNGVTPASVAGVSPSFNELQLKEMKAPAKVRRTLVGGRSACTSWVSCSVVGWEGSGQAMKFWSVGGRPYLALVSAEVSITHIQSANGWWVS